MNQDNIDITHFHLNECPSTQTLLKEKWDEATKSPILVSTDHQTQGIGRQGKVWKSCEQALAMSFTLEPNSILTLTSLEIGILICRFFKDHALKLKWPNDLILDGQKVGGILCQNTKNTIFVGLGLNLYQSSPLTLQDSFYQAGSLFKEPIEIQIEKLSLDIYHYILENRLKPIEVKSLWEERCDHLNTEVQIFDEQLKFNGIFKGIGPHGEALIGNKSFVSGSLKY